ncbi:hypothetical protein M3Y94_01259200 [Aphelenchoides besseyi]|nr:hypothetical protein M3Y94_01259200 [Aphelenchoides besseyi]
MPLVSVFTNLKRSEVSIVFLRKTSELLGRLLDKSSATIQIAVHTDQLVHCFNNEEPAAFIHVSIADRIGLEKRKEVVAELTNLISSELKLNRKRFFIKFPPTTKDDVSYDGRLLSDLQSPTKSTKKNSKL